MNKLKFNDLNIKNYTNFLSIYKISPPPPFHSEEMLVNLKEEESALLVFLCY